MGTVHDFLTGQIIEKPYMEEIPPSVMETIAMLQQRRHQITSIMVSWMEADGQIKCAGTCSDRDEAIDLYMPLNAILCYYADVDLEDEE